MRPLEKLLADWLPQQRWFAGKDREISAVGIDSDTELVAGEPGLRHLILAVRQEDDVDRYQLLTGVRRETLPQRLEYAGIGVVEGSYVYDAVHDPELTRVLLENLASGASVGPLRFHAVPGAEIDTDLVSLANTAEQSNSSLIFGDSYICKLFRRLTSGVNPDLELNLGLTGKSHVPELHGWIELADREGDGTTLAMLSEFLRTATDGWQLATTSVRDFYAFQGAPFGFDDSFNGHSTPPVHAGDAGGDFAAEAERLGAATAEVHRHLAEEFGVTTQPADEVRALADGMLERLEETRLAVPELEPYAGRLAIAFEDLAKHEEPVPVQRIHGDFHLGQVMRNELGWILIDFEGEPSRPLEERRTPASPMRDVAGMLRSFEYAARHLLGDLPGTDPMQADEEIESRARDWADRNRAAFCRGYTGAGGPDPADHEALIRAFELDKAVYEVLYEARNRPNWLHIPLGSLAHLTA